MPPLRDRIVELRRVPASLIDGAPWNWRTHPGEQRAVVQASIEELGIIDALKVRAMPDGRYQLFDGHLRSDLYVTISPDTLVPVLVTDLDEAEAKKANAIFDPSAAMAEADAAKLDALLKEIETDSAAIESMLAELAQDNGLAEEVVPGAGGDEFDATPEATGPTRTAVGELWLIGGKHRLLVGDNTIAENVERLMGGKRVGLCFTSPPYGQQRDYGEAAKEKVQDWHALMLGTFANLPMTDDGQVLVNLGLIHRDGEWIPYWDGWIEWMRSQGWRRFGWYVWDQGSGLPGIFGGRCAPSHEFIFHFNKATTTAEKWQPTKSEGHKIHGGRMGANGWETDYHISRVNVIGPEKIPDSTWRVQRAPDARIEHSAKFPVGLPTYALETWPSDVYDPYMGSWTTGLAAHRLGLTSYGCELEPKFADVCLRRAEAEGLTVEKIG